MANETYEIRCATETTSWIETAKTADQAKSVARGQNKEANLDSMAIYKITGVKGRAGYAEVKVWEM